MSTPLSISNHAEQALNLLTSMFRGRPVIEGLTSAFAKEIQRWESAAWGVINGRNLASGEGVALDAIGALIGESRKGKSDEDYRKALSLRILINRSTGRIGEILKILDAIIRYSPSGVVWRYYDSPPAGFTLELKTLDTGVYLALADGIRETKPAGVECSLIHLPLAFDAVWDKGLVPGSVSGDPSNANGPGTAVDSEPVCIASHVERI